MEDFAALLVQARERAGLTQSQAAVAAGLTPSYLSFIENRKKPPPSDDVCRRLAEVLDIPARQLIEIAHMERAPETVRKRVRKLDSTLKRERRSRLRALRALLSPFLYTGPPGYLDGVLDTFRVGPRRRRRIREVLTAVGRHRHDRANEVERIVDKLPENDRALLLEMLPRLLEEQRPATPARPEPPTDAPPLLYGPPAADAMPEGPYLLEVTSETLDSAGADLSAGDRLLVDPGLGPEVGDLIVLRGAGGAVVRRLESAAGGKYHLSGSGRDSPLDEAGLAAHLAHVGAGTVLEIRRPLRRRRPPA